MQARAQEKEAETTWVKLFPHETSLKRLQNLNQQKNN